MKLFERYEPYKAAGPVLRDPESVAKYVTDLSEAPTEHLYALLLNARAQLLTRPVLVSKGDVEGTDAGPRETFRVACGLGAVQVIVVHNHPTGDPSPSNADHAVTKRLVAAGRTLDIPLVDHVIIGSGGRHHSLRQHSPGLFGAS